MEPTQEKKTTTTKKIMQFIGNSAPFALLLSLVFFVVEFTKNDIEFDRTMQSFAKTDISFTETLSKLKEIEQSLSTRNIGIFPNYLKEINQLLEESLVPQNKIDTIIILEDLLFYGAFYNGTEFKEMIQLLNKLAADGKKITIAYYNNVIDWEAGKMFREVVQESWIRPEDLIKLNEERRERMSLLSNESKRGRKEAMRNLITADSIASEICFAIFRDDKQRVNNQNTFSERRDEILQFSLYDASKDRLIVFKKMDDIKNKCLGKEIKKITFSDIYNMYAQFTDELKTFFEDHGIEVIPLQEYLTMFSWSNGKSALFVFPGRFGSEEIGFISHDDDILDYINTMLIGVKDLAKNRNNERF